MIRTAPDQTSATLLPAEKARTLMPTFNPAATLVRISDLIAAAAKKGCESVDIMSVMPRYEGDISPTVVNERRAYITQALREAGYALDYYSGGHHGDASYTVSWAKT